MSCRHSLLDPGHRDFGLFLVCTALMIFCSSKYTSNPGSTEPDSLRLDEPGFTVIARIPAL
ncbi:hypothetical protein [Kibdelosporangium philippinense]|uniref:hypothetical protein n=1 Tax=Kibdelosporangium philippinense TaxID=211113 RepID=UPI0036235C31